MPNTGKQPHPRPRLLFTPGNTSFSTQTATPPEKRGEQTRGEEVYQWGREEGGHRKERGNNPILKVINHVN
jgi:hypothetical protein